MFTPTSSNPAIYLEPGTYSFVFCNQYVTVSGNNLTVSRENAEFARVGVVNEAVLAINEQTITLPVKHAGSRVRMQVSAFMPFDNQIKATLAGNIPSSVTYQADQAKWVINSETSVSDNFTFPASQLGGSTPEHTTYYKSFSTEYKYFLNGASGPKLQATFTGGTLYQKSIPNVPITLSTRVGTLKPNGSYRIEILLYYKHLYLFSDGTTGYYNQTKRGGGTKDPIAIVINDDLGIAMALNDIPTNVKWYNNTDYIKQMNSTTFTAATAYQDMNGYQWTWNADGSHDGVTIKANSDDYPAFKAAATYVPGVAVTGSNIGKWYLPSLGEWAEVFKIGYGNSALLTKTNHEAQQTYGSVVNSGIDRVKGTGIYGKNYWVSTEIDAQRAGKIFFNAILFDFLSLNKDGDNRTVYVRPFVRYK